MQYLELVKLSTGMVTVGNDMLVLWKKNTGCAVHIGTFIITCYI